MGQHVSVSSRKPPTSSSPNVIRRHLRATKRESAISLASLSPSASGNGVPRSPSPVPAKRNCNAAVDSCTDPLALPESWEDEDGHQFHVHQRNGVKICDGFLLGNCSQGKSCLLHHTRYPYHWQLKPKECPGWRSLSDSAQQHLEKLYSDFENLRVTLVDKHGTSGILDLDLMQLASFGSYDGIRRLSNTCSPQTNPHFPTKWTWYWKSAYDWRELDEPFNSDLLLPFEKGPDSLPTEIQGELPAVDLEQSPMTVHQYPIQRRPGYCSFLSMAPFLQTVRRKHNPELQLPASGIPEEDPTDWYCGPYPVASLFQSAGPASASSGFVQLEVGPLEAAYRSTKKESLSVSLSQMKELQLEKHLFYGTWAEKNSTICRMNFDPCLPGLFSPIYGEGTYFHVDSAQAHSYTLPDKDKLRYMFLAKILVGRSISGEEHYRRTKKLLPVQETYESCVDNKENPKIFVTFKRSQCYPYFLICYKLLSDPVAVGI
ncbi:hypothetical protein lerEdw1_011958 [Lerista edwardsae]|nr:hypothetical protein lerEdw1_011958 [Lerista edwardsae]